MNIHKSHRRLAQDEVRKKEVEQGWNENRARETKSGKCQDKKSSVENEQCPAQTMRGSRSRPVRGMAAFLALRYSRVVA